MTSGESATAAEAKSTGSTGSTSEVRDKDGHVLTLGKGEGIWYYEDEQGALVYSDPDSFEAAFADGTGDDSGVWTAAEWDQELGAYITPSADGTGFVCSVCGVVIRDYDEANKCPVCEHLVCDSCVFGVAGVCSDCKELERGLGDQGYY